MELTKYLRELSDLMVEFSSSDDIIEAAAYLNKAANSLLSHELKKMREKEK